MMNFIELEMQKLEKFLNITSIEKSTPEYNKIRRIINECGFNYLEFNFLKYLDKENMTIKMVIEQYELNANLSKTIIKELFKMENLLTSRLIVIAKQKKDIWKILFSKKTIIFQSLSADVQNDIVKSINKKCSVEDYNEAILYANILRNKISHNNVIINEIKIPTKLKPALKKDSFNVKDITKLLDSISGDEKYISDIYKNMSIKK